MFGILKKAALADRKDRGLYSTSDVLMVLAECSSLASTLTYAHVVSHVQSQDQHRCSAENCNQNLGRNNIVALFEALYNIGCKDRCFTAGAFRIA